VSLFGGLSARHVRRPRLTRLLDASTAQAIVIVAPAGYGKTTLAAEWLEGRKRVAWFRATSAAADLAAFSTGLAAAAARVIPEAGARLGQRLRVDEMPEDAAKPLAEVLAEDLTGWPDDGWLVVDDYHLAGASEAVESFVDWLLSLTRVRLLATTRRRPGWATARRVLYGEVTEIGRDDLAMTREEAAAVLGDSPGVEPLVERAQGWPAVIGLAGLSTSSTARGPRMADALYRYFAEEVFRSEPPDVQAVMLAAAVPGRVDPHTAADALELGGVEGALERLQAEGLLNESPGGGLAFHPLLRDFLVRKLAEERPEQKRRLVERSIERAHAAGHTEEAFELAVDAGLLETAADLLVALADGLLAAGRLETVERWLDAVRAAAEARTLLRLARAEVLLRRGRLFESAELAHDIALGLPEGDALASRSWHFAGRCLQLLSEDERAFECHVRAVDLASSTRDLSRALCGAVTLAAQLDSDVLERLVARLEEAAGDLDARLELISARLYLGSRNGTLAGIWRDVEPLLHRSGEASDPLAWTSFLNAAAYLAVSRGEYALARDVAERSVRTCEELRLGSMKTAFGLCYIVAADIGRRRFADAERTLERLSSLGIEQTRILVAEQRNLRTKLLLARGDAVAALAEVPHGDGTGAPSGELAGLLALAAAAVGQVTPARTWARRADAARGSIEARFYAAFARLVLRVRGAPAAPRTRRAAAELVVAAAEAALHDAFVIAYRAYPPLLELVQSDALAGPIARDLAARAHDAALARRLGIALARTNGETASRLGPLTPRENEVLELMTLGLANAEIARRLFISEKTTKVHVSHIFDKLGVESRVQAVLVARNALPETRPQP